MRQPNCSVTEHQLMLNATTWAQGIYSVRILSGSTTLVTLRAAKL